MSLKKLFIGLEVHKKYDVKIRDHKLEGYWFLAEQKKKTQSSATNSKSMLKSNILESK